MSGRNRGFDPLSSLFEVPEPGGLTLPEIDDMNDTSSPGSHIELTDPLYKAPPDLAGITADAPEPPVRLNPPPVAAPSMEQRAEMAKAIARAATARALAAQAAPPARPAPSPLPPPAEGPSMAQRAEMAKAIAKAAAAKAKAAAPPPARPAAPSPAAAPAPAPAAPPAKPARAATTEQGPPPKRSRLDALTARARRPTSALEAARQAAEREQDQRAEIAQAAEEATQQERQQRVNDLADLVQGKLPDWLPSVGPVYVANAVLADPREILQALWKAHRAKFLAEGELERAVGAAAVLSALDNVPQDRLVAAHVVTDASDYLVWLDLERGGLVAAFSNARAYFAGGQS